jgi:hypothetical protein
VSTRSAWRTPVRWAYREGKLAAGGCR